MKISIALCTFNGSKYLIKQLQSILSQTRLPNELIVCDDGSSDRTAEIVKSYVDNAPFSTYFFENEKRLGSTKNFEKAISLCTGDIIFLSDQDDVWDCQKIEKIMQTFEGNGNIGYVFSDAELVDENLNLLGVSLWNALNFKGKIRHFIKGKQIEVLIGKNYITGATLAFNSGLKEIILPISGYWVHDGWIALLASAIGMYGLPLHDCLVKYRRHNQQQIGVHMGFLEQVIHTQGIGPIEFAREVTALYDLKERFLQFKTKYNFDIDGTLRLIDEKIKYLEARIKIYSLSGIKKWAAIFTQIRQGNYRRFASSWLSIGKDIFFKG